MMCVIINIVGKWINEEGKKRASGKELLFPESNLNPFDLKITTEPNEFNFPKYWYCYKNFSPAQNCLIFFLFYFRLARSQLYLKFNISTLLSIDYLFFTTSTYLLILSYEDMIKTSKQNYNFYAKMWSLRNA